jgi:hypothetical protein
MKATPIIRVADIERGRTSVEVGSAHSGKKIEEVIASRPAFDVSHSCQIRASLYFASGHSHLTKP